MNTKTVSEPKTKESQSVRMRYLTITGLFAAMIAIMTAYICHIPVGANNGYIHFGDSLIYLAAALLPTPYALAAAAIGGGLAASNTLCTCGSSNRRRACRLNDFPAVGACNHYYKNADYDSLFQSISQNCYKKKYYCYNDCLFYFRFLLL